MARYLLFLSAARLVDRNSRVRTGVKSCGSD
jgi:hypothetical protein